MTAAHTRLTARRRAVRRALADQSMIHKRDLPVRVPPTEGTDADGQPILLVRPQPELHCFACGGSYSADPGDYWNYPDDHVFVCCDEPMRLGQFRRTWVEWEQP